MEKKTAILLTSLLISTLLLTTPYFIPSTIAAEPAVKHWKIVLAQKQCNAKIVGFLTDPLGDPIPGTDFALMCNESFVFAKVKNVTANVHDIDFTKWVDWDLDGEWEEVAVPVVGDVVKPVDPYDHVWYQHEQVNGASMVVVEVQEEPYDSARPYMEWQLTLLAQNTTYQPSVKARVTGFLSNETVAHLSGTDFNITVGPDYKPVEPPPVNVRHNRIMACVVVKTPWSTIVRDINYTLLVDWDNNGVWDLNYTRVKALIIQFPWTWNTTGPDGKTVSLELTEVQMHRYILMEGQTNAFGQLAANPEWLDIDWGVPAYDRLLTPASAWKFTNDTKVILTSPVGSNWTKTAGSTPGPYYIGSKYKLTSWTDTAPSGLSANDWVGLTLKYPNGTLRSGMETKCPVMTVTQSGKFTNISIAEPSFEFNTWKQMPGMGVPFATRPPDLTPYYTDKFALKTYGQNITFTQMDPITGIVKLGVPAESYVGIDHPYYSPRLSTYFRVMISSDDQGCGWLFTGEGKDPVLGDVDVITFNNSTGAYSNRTGKLMTMRPCLQGLRGDDEIPGTRDDINDPFGDGTDDPAGSYILLIPSIQTVLYWRNDTKVWAQLFSAPWPQPFTTGTASDIVVEAGTAPNNRLAVVHANKTVSGAPMEFVAGIDHAKEGWKVNWKHPKCNAYSTIACAWSIINTQTVLGVLDVMFFTVQKAYREDCLIPDVAGGDEKINILDIGRIGIAFGSRDEVDYGKDGRPMTADDRISADQYPSFDAGADLVSPEGKINILDIGRVAIDFGAYLTPTCIIRP